MKKIFVSTLVLLFVVTLSACQKTTEQKDMSMDNKAEENIAKDTQVSMKDDSSVEFDDMDMSAPQKCTWTENGEVMSVMYVDAGRMRTDSTAQEEGMNIAASMINDGEWIYSWDDDTKMGTKFKNEELEDDMADESEMEVEYTQEDAVDEAGDLLEQMKDMNYKFSCEKWSVDESVFIPPTDVQFTDMNAMMKQMENITIPQMNQ